MTAGAPRPDGAADDAAALWELHFGDPEPAFLKTQSLLAQADTLTPLARAWSELTVAYHHLFFTARPLDARQWIDAARGRFAHAGNRRGELLAEIGAARLAIAEHSPAAARDRLLALYPEAQQVLPRRDRFWLLNAIGAGYYFTDQLDEAIRYLYEALETLRDDDRSPQHPTVMSNLAAALVTVGDYTPAAELAAAALEALAHHNNPQLVMFARSNYAEALSGIGEHERALAVIDEMLADVPPGPRRTGQNHYLSIAAETLARHGRVDDARRCADAARVILAEFPGGYNEAHSRWADAVVADARGDQAQAIELLQAAGDAAERQRYLPGESKAWARLTERYARQRAFEAAYSCASKLLRAERARLSHRASAKYYLLRVEHELTHARAERDRAHAQRLETERLNAELERLNSDLQHKMIQVEALKAQLSVEAVHDPLTQLFNRRYLDSVMPGLLAAAERRGTPLALAMIDLDHFKQVNDRFGHPAGDAVLREIGRVLPRALRPADVVCRYGGEEFCIALPDADGAGAQKALASLAARLGDLRVEWNGRTLGGFTFSAGVALLGTHGRNMADLVSAADRAMYEAKAAGRDRVFVAEPSRELF